MAQAEARERAARVGVGVRRPLAGQIRAGTVSPSTPAGQPSAAAEQLVVARPRAPAASRSQRSDPAADSITPIACQAARDGMAERRARGPRGSATYRSQRREHDARGAEHDRRRPGRDRRRRRARRPPGRRPRPRPACPSACTPETAGLSSSRGSHAASSSSALEHRRAPAPLRRRRAAASRTRPRRRSRAHRRAAAARSPSAAGPARSGRTRPARGARSHSSLGAVKPGSARFPVSSISRSSPSVCSISPHSAARALVVPEDRRPQDPVVVVERDEAVHLARSARSRPAGRPPRAAAPAPLGRPPPVARAPARPSPGAASRADRRSSALASTAPSRPMASPFRPEVPTSSPTAQATHSTAGAPSAA